MYPTLLEIGPIVIRTYGALVALAFLVGIGMARREATLHGMAEKDILDLAFVVVVTGLLGARAFYVLLNFRHFAQNPVEIFKIWEGGLVFYGGLLAALPAALAFAHRRAMPLGRLADSVAPALAAGHGIGRLGCFFAGCCYGRPTRLPWGIIFQDPQSLGPLHIRLHPTPLYESVGNWVIAALLWKMLRDQRTGVAPDPPAGRPVASLAGHPAGRVFWMYLLLYACLRFALEFLRGDDRGPRMGGLYPSQILAVGMGLLAFAVVLSLEVKSSKPATIL